MAVDTKLTTVQNGVLGVREAIKDIDSTLAGGSITTLGDDIRTLNNRKYVYKWVREGQEVSNTTTGTLSKSDFSSSDYTEQSYNTNNGVGYLEIPVGTYSDWSITITKINGGDNHPCIYNLSNTYGPYSTIGAPVDDVGDTKTISKADYPSETSVYVCGYWRVGNNYQDSPWSYDAFMNWMTLTITYSVTTSNTVYSYSLQRDINNTDNIAASKYNGNTSICAVVFHENIKIVNDHAFRLCTNLQYVNLANIESFGSRAFSEGGKLISAVMPNAKTIGVYAFYCQPLTYVEVGENITSIGSNSFYTDVASGSYVTDRVFVIRATNPITISSDAFRSNNNGWVYDNLTIYVPYGCGNAYKAATGWSTYASVIQELNEDGSIPS